MHAAERLVALLAGMVCLGLRAASASCVIPDTRLLPCDPAKGQVCPIVSAPGGLYPGEAFATYAHGDPRFEYCKVGGTIPAGRQCEVECKSGYGDMDAGSASNHVACGADGNLDWTMLPSCVLCDEYSYQDEQSSDVCELCPSNLFTGITGATSVAQCDKCKPGTTGTPPGNCRLPPRPGKGWGDCPDRCDPSTGQRCAWHWNSSKEFPYDFSHFANSVTTCDVVNIVAVAAAPQAEPSVVEQWVDGLQIFQEHINSRGGLRLGNNSVGYVNVTVLRVPANAWPRYEKAQKYRNAYANLCFDDGKHGRLGSGWRSLVANAPTLYLTPPDVEDDVTDQILGLSLEDCEGETFLVSSEARFPVPPKAPWPGVFSVYGQESGLLAGTPGERTMSPVELLYGPPYNARTFGIAGVEANEADKVAQSLREKIDKLPGAALVAPYQLAVSMSGVALHNAMRTVADARPDVFIGIGDGHGVAFEGMLSFFATNNGSGYSPNASFYMGGLAVTSQLWKNSYTYGVPEETVRNKKVEVDSKYLPCKGSECWSFDQWMGFVPWAADMPHAGPGRWPDTLPNQYHMAADDTTEGNDHRFGMRQRYLGSAKDFNDRASDWLKRNGRDTHSPSFYHAKAAASLLLFQMAVEFAPDGNGFGLTYTELTRDNIESAMNEMNNSQGVETFWGPIRIRPGQGWNDLFLGMSIGQFRNNQTYPSLVRYTGRSKNFTQNADYPAKWPDWCLVHGQRWFNGECPIIYLHEGELILVSVVLVLTAMALVICCCAYVRRRNKRYAESTRPMRASLLGSTELPNNQLTALDIAQRWASRRMAAQADAALFSSVSAGGPGSKSNKAVPVHIASGGTGIGLSARKYSGLTPQTQVPVMFSDSHVRELQPADWRQIPKNRLGKGSYGTVYRAEWRGVKVAVKAIELPSCPENDRDTAMQAHKKKLQKITQDFVKEVDVGCELLHPNLVQMLGYATEPTLLIIQELLTGGSLDKQLYVEHWRPNKIQLLKGALDVAQAIEHLHTHFERGAKGRQSKVTLPVIHRDLKSPNILLDRPPPLKSKARDWPVELKVSDFGLSRDKQLDTHDDKTGAMSGVGSVLWMAPEMLRAETYNESVDVYSYAMVLIELSHGTMPWQDTGARPHEVPHRVANDERPLSQLREAPEELRELIQDCWHKYLNANRDAAERLSNVREVSTSAERSSVIGGSSTEYSTWESSRPASPSAMQQLGGAAATFGESDLASY